MQKTQTFHHHCSTEIFSSKTSNKKTNCKIANALKKVADSLRKRINVVDDLFRFFIFVISGRKLSLSL